MKNIGRNARPVALVVTLKIKRITDITDITGMNLSMTAVFRIVIPTRDIRDVSNNVTNTIIMNTIIMNTIKAATLIRNAGIALA
jgi:hypothetical protein